MRPDMFLESLKCIGRDIFSVFRDHFGWCLVGGVTIMVWIRLMQVLVVVELYVYIFVFFEFSGKLTTVLCLRGVAVWEGL